MSHMGPSAQVPTAEGAILDKLWVRLREANSDIEVTQKCTTALDRTEAGIFSLATQWTHDEVQPLLASCKEQRTRLQDHMIELEARRDTLRLDVNEHSRSLIRPLTVLDLPDEILRSIFKIVSRRPESFKFATANLFNFAGATESVERLRLTCRRFHDTSSHLLMKSIMVDMTAESIARLTEVSHHPTISKGICVVKVSVGRHFNGGLAYNFQAFAQYRLWELQNSIEQWRRNIAHPEIFLKHAGACDTSVEGYTLAIDQACALVPIWQGAGRDQVVETCPEFDLLKTAWRQFQRSHELQLLLQREAFVQSIASAMDRMPTAAWLSIVDRGEHPGSRTSTFRTPTFLPKDLGDSALLQLKLQGSIDSWAIAIDGSRSTSRSLPIDTIPSILSAMAATGIRLKGIACNTPVLEDLSALSTTRVDYSKLRATSHQLREFEFRPRGSLPGNMSLDTSNILGGFLSAMLASNTLQIIYLDFNQYYHPPSSNPTASMATVLLSCSWPRLKDLYFNGPFRFEDLKQIVSRIDNEVEFRWAGYLMDASWVSVLDFLRESRVSSRAHIGGTGSIRSIAGAELERMSDEETLFIFGDELERMIAKKALFIAGDDFRTYQASQASRFIRGSVEKNPMREWVNGDLVI